MRTGHSHPIIFSSLSLFLLFFVILFSVSSEVVIASSVLPHGVDVVATHSLADARSSVRLTARYRRSLDNPAYLPAQIGGIVGAYALCLVVVAFTLLLLSKRRREHLETGEDFEFLQQVVFQQPLPESVQLQDAVVPYALKTPAQTNFSYPSPTSPTTQKHSNPSYIAPSFTSSFRAPGVDPFVDPEIVSADREMAQSQLEEMYKLVMEQEEAKANGIVLTDPPPPISPASNKGRNNANNPFSNSAANDSNDGSVGNNSNNDNKHRKGPSNSSTATLLRREKTKPQSLNLSLGGGSNKDERTSRASSILSVLMSPRKKKMQGMNISSPIMTPMSGTFPRTNADGEEMNPIPPRFYAPAAPPPVPSAEQTPRTAGVQSQYYHQPQQRPGVPNGAPLTPDISPLSTVSIDERIGAAIATQDLPPPPSRQHQHGAAVVSSSTATSIASEADPESAISQDSVNSSAPLVGLPTSPKPGVNRFPSLSSLPASPRATTFQHSNGPTSPRATAFQNPNGPTLQRPNAPSALRTGGTLPLRAYQPAITSPSYATHNQTKQTVFERSMPLSPSGAQTPWTGAPVPYSPYQPFSPVVPITPSLVTKADRKRMRRLEPKTPTMELVKSVDDTW
ncbi:hypothetical protein SPI_08307 [Niveomyces insectorum RCEF 264]|uniref:Uncharacterized protein n=1 Tax=Niveomyces insectorum RCEF 264 TaxID=1081102 RepID=A0A167N777_9HYPO|nr:hypothetical protein SPI_08307 [Niveomyces insectorum RCEF 264]